MARFGLAAMVALVAAAAWMIGRKLRTAGEELAPSATRPGPDSGVRSYGEVWDFPEAA